MLTSEKYKELTIKEFDKAAEKYEGNEAGVYKICRYDYPYMLEEIEKYGEFETLLDAGCGTAPMISLLKEKYPNKKYTGIDLSPKMIEQAKKKNLENTEFIVGDCENLPFQDNSFDIVINSHSFHHYPNVQDFFNEVYRVLKPNGKLILRDHTGNKLVQLFFNKFELPIANKFGKGDVKLYSEEEVRELCQKSNLYVETLEQRKHHRLHLVAVKKI
ncbi:putative methyltransferase type 11 [Anaeromyces robustus]|uniref:Putative methyltransferase type 11 n=1 Tax=Anaeromyces robustus TaxID=1754192 RepID=A0A1Y1XHF6_9FUNG|nr:putative methyltransferase type 11 [Anaeromyces robustus]|eukprot:ORX85170.1 putative methyltransferase type 11 [Anaeromyces robustus]